MNKLLFLATLARKYIFRNKARSFFILSSISVSLIVAMMILSLFSGLFAQIEKAVTDTNTGHIQLQEKNFADSADPLTPQVWNSQLENKLSSTQGFSPELLLEGNIVAPEGSAALMVLGIDPARHLSVLELGHNLSSGDFFESSKLGVVIGSELARKFKFKVGDDLLINFQDVDGELRSELLPISGIYDFNSKEFSKSYVYLHYSTWQELFFKEDKDLQLFHRIVIKNDVPLVHPPLNLVLKTWKDINPEMAVVIEFNKGLLNFFMIIIAITVGLSVFNPIRMLLEERLGEFRMMNVIGVSHRTLIPLGILEALIMMIISLVVSLTIYITLTTLLSYVGVDLSTFNEGRPIERAGIEMPNVIYPLWEAKHIILSVVFVIITIGFTYAVSFHSILKRLKGA